MKPYATLVTLTALALAYLAWRQAGRIARLDRQCAGLRRSCDETSAALHEAHADNDALTVKVADYEAITKSWSASVIEGGDQ